MTPDLRQIVFANLNDARANGAFEPNEHLDGATAQEIAEDMVAMAEDCENFRAAELVPFVQEWLDAQAHQPQGK
jgi:hypothetical protein